MKGVLVDSSAWIEFLRDGASSVGDRVDLLLGEGLARVLDPIVAEVVSGARNRRDLGLLRDTLAAVPRAGSPADLWDRVAESRFELRRKGFEASLVDLWIALVASHDDLPLLTLDPDFDRIAEIVPLDFVAVG